MAERRSHRKGTLASDAVASAKILSRWVERFKAEARAGTIHRSSRPRVMPGMTDPAFAERLRSRQPNRSGATNVSGSHLLSLHPRGGSFLA